MGWFPNWLRKSDDGGVPINTPAALAEAVRAAMFGGTSTGIAVSPSRAMQVSAVFACIRVLSETAAMLPLPLYRRRPDRGRDQVREHPLHRILNKQANPWQTAFEFREMMTGHCALRGNAYAFKSIATGGRLTAMIPLHPDKVTPKQRNDFSIIYEYRPGNGRPNKVLAAEEIFHLRGLTSDGFIGLSPIALQREAIGLSIATTEFGGRFFQNDARPGLVLSHPGKLGDEGVRNVKEAWIKHHQGLEHAHDVAVLQEDMKVTQIGVTPEDAQFLETRRYQGEEIARIFRMPPHKIGIMDKATFSNIEQQAKEFVDDTMMPWFVRWEQAVERDLLTRAEQRDHFVKHKAQALLRGDMKGRSEFYSKMITHGVYSPNDVRELEDENPREGGDIYLTPTNLQPSSALLMPGGKDDDD